MKRSVIYRAVPVALLFVITACGGPRLKIYNWTYYTPDTVINKYEREYKVRVEYDQFASNEELYAKLKSGGSGYDIVFPSGDYVSIMIQQGMLEKIDKSKIPNLKNVDPQILQKINYDPNMDYSVPYFYGAAGVVVNTAKVPDFERSWSIFNRPDLRNRMTMLDDMREVMGGALAFLGYSINTKNPVQIAAARDLINNSWKPNLVKFDAESFGKGYANGDFWVVHGYAEVVFEEIEGNPLLLQDTVFFFPAEGGASFIDNMCILKGSKNVELAHTFIDFIHRPEIYAEFVDTFSFPSTANIPARQYTTGDSLYNVEDITSTELLDDIGQALDLYNDVWFNSIRIGE
ncbi:MAG: extracellular solute-binding protein [Treponema sp.]|nr:extracellular solute-binding protein [Treponema sp.]